MNIRQINLGARSNAHKVIAAIVLTAVITYLCLNNADITEFAANILADNAFYIPRKNTVNFNGRTLLREVCFGGEYYDIEEKTVILHDNTSVPEINSENTEVLPESGIQPDVPSENSSNMLPIISCDLSCEDIFTLNNTTGERPDTEKLLRSDYDFGYDPTSSDPLVLIVHTHATECYSREGSTYYDPNSSTRSTDNNVNMVAVGKVLSDTLNNAGISTIHCTVQHDAESYRDSYTLAAKSIKEYINKYPSIRYVFDLHRDAVMYESGAKARAVTELDGKEAAQIMILAGTDAGGADFPDWEKNLTLALKIADKISGKYPGVLRPIALRGASYNEQYTNGSLLIEIGTDGNTLSQAKYSAKLLANSLTELIKSEK